MTMVSNRIKRRFVIVLFFTFIPLFILGQQSLSDYDAFLGVWEKSNSDPKWNYGDLKITENSGKIYVQMKTDEGVKKTVAHMDNGTLSWYYNFQVNYGKWQLGGWWQGEYCRDRIIVCHSDGSYGSDGDCSGRYQNNKSNTANKEIEYIGFRAYIEEGNLKLYYLIGSDYCDGDIPLFYQSSNWVFYDIYTNW